MNEGPSDPESFRRLEEAFHEAQALPESERSVWLATCLGGDGALRDRLERMLANAESETPTRGVGEGLADGTVAESSRSRAMSGRLRGMRLGGYRLIEFKGEGGFGEVYLAEQLEPIRRRVAIKVLRDDRAWGDSLDRFKGEVESLARLEHPGIARIYDAGEATPVPDGGDATSAPDVSGHPVPFIAMEFVDGVTITTDATRRGAGLRERLRVVASAADAIHYAHQRGIIHRDIKPSNLLVTEVNGVATPKIIDFGIAKVMGTALSERASVPSLELRSRAVTGVVGTPRYMSPEQSDRRRSQDVDTRTDIYSIGVILGELLHGSRPAAEADAVQVPGATWTGWSVDVPRSMRDDLDRVIRTATHPDRERRYTSATAFADDLRRITVGDAISVGPATLRYRVQRLIGRNPAIVAAVLVAGAALVGGAIATGLGLVKAKAAAARADAVKGFLEDILTSVNPDRRGAEVPLSSVMDEASAQASARFAGQPLVEAETRMLIADVNVNLWRIDSATRELRTARDLYAAELGPESGPAVHAHLRLAQAMAAMGKVKEADAESGGLLEEVRRTFGPRSREAAVAELLRVRIAVSRGRIDEGMIALREASMLIDEKFRSDADLVTNMLLEKLRLARTRSYMEAPGSEAADGFALEAYALSVELVEHERRRVPQRAVAALHASVSLARAAVDVNRLRQAIDVCDGVLQESEGKLSECHETRIDANDIAASALRMMGDVVGAAERMRKVIACIRVNESKPTLFRLSREFDFIAFLMSAGAFEETERQCELVVSLLDSFDGADADMRLVVDCNRARAISCQGRKEEATRLFVELEARIGDLARKGTRAQLHAFRAAHLASIGRAEDARIAIAASFEALPGEDRGISTVHVDDRLMVLIEAYRVMGDEEQVEACREMQARLLDTNRKTP